MTRSPHPLKRMHERNAEANLKNFIARQKVTADIAFTWDEPIWDVTKSLRASASEPVSHRLRFGPGLGSGNKRVRLGADWQPFSEPFLSFSKAIVVSAWRTTDASYHTCVIWLTSLRFLFGVSDDVSNHPTRLSPDHLDRAIEAASNHGYVSGTLLNIATYLQLLAELIDEERITPFRLGWKHNVARSQRMEIHSKAAIKRRLDKLPAQQVLEALADISNRITDPRDIIGMRITELLVAGGFRIGEILTLEVGCWQETPARKRGRPVKDQNGNPVIIYGTIYHVQKAKTAPPLKVIPAAHAALAKRAVNDLTHLLAPFREAVAWMKRHPGRLPFQHLPRLAGPDQWCTYRELALELGATAKAAQGLVERLGIKSEIRPTAICGPRRSGIKNVAHIRIRTLESALIEKLKPKPVRKAHGLPQDFDRRLIVVPRHFWSGEVGNWGFSPEPVGRKSISDFLGASQGTPKSTKSVFERFGYPVDFKLLTHQPRHLLNTYAQEGGMPDLLLAKWMGRDSPSANEPYLHKTGYHFLQETRELFEAGNAIGLMARAFASVPAEDRKEWLETHIQTIHFTPMGRCLRDLDVSPCPHYMNCLRGCRDHIIERGNLEQRNAILEMRDTVAQQMELIEGQIGREESLQNNLYRRNAVVRHHCDRAIELIDSPGSKGLARVNPQGYSYAEADPPWDDSLEEEGQ